MKKHILFLSAIVLSILCGCSEIAGDPITKDFTIDEPFSELEVQDSFIVTVSNDADRVTVTAGENIMPKVVVETIDGILKIHLKWWGSVRNGWSDLKVTIPNSPRLKKVELSGASEFRSDYTLLGERVDVYLSGASKFFGKVDSGNLDLVMSGASYATISGGVDILKMKLSGASEIVEKTSGNRYAISCNNCEGEMSGASKARLHCDGDIKLNLSGASKLHYTGNATTGDCKLSGSSKIIHEVL